VEEEGKENKRGKNKDERKHDVRRSKKKRAKERKEKYMRTLIAGGYQVDEQSRIFPDVDEESVRGPAATSLNK
jgi:hypothetical protein